ncbi:hypothetical protein [Actinocorallia libanotica]|uniref:hypothetical protein n=1 Tax=Actinocorallia libanotica TaxID=46162 RepID=UPI0031DC6DA9
MAESEVEVDEMGFGEVDGEARPVGIGRVIWFGGEVPLKEALGGEADLEFLARRDVGLTGRHVGTGLGRATVRHAQIGADDIGDGLTVGRMVLGEALQGVKATEPDSGFVVAELLDGLAVQLSDTAFDGVMSRDPSHLLDMGLSEPGDAFGMGLDTLRPLTGGFVDTLAAIGGDQGDESPDTGDESEDELQQLQLRGGVQRLGFGPGRRPQQPGQTEPGGDQQQNRTGKGEAERPPDRPQPQRPMRVPDRLRLRYSILITHI